MIGSQAVRHEAGLLWLTLTTDSRQTPGEKNVSE